MIPVVVAIAVVSLVAMVLQWRRAASSRSDVDARDRLIEAIEERLGRARDDVFRLTAALDGVPQAVVVVDAFGRELLRNKAATAFVGARHGEALVMRAVQDELDAARGGVAQQRNLDLYGPPPRHLVITSTPLEAGGAAAVIDDVSERRRLDAMRRDFVANISHELKTPVGALGVLAEAMVDASDDDGKRLASRMTEEALRVGRIIDDLLELTRIEGEESDPSGTVCIGDVVEDALQRVVPTARARRIEIDAACVDRDQVVVGDARQLTSAIANLVDNACKYSDEGSKIVVRSRVDAGWFELDVEDHGIGIPSTDVERVFERFYRVDRARSRETGGTGLGLSIVRHVVTNHRGEVRVQSTEGAGSTFTVRLPIGAVSTS